MAGHVLAVVGGKGGVGKSVFAANLTIATVQESKQRPLLVDLDLTSLGDQNIILGLNPPKSIVDVSKLPPGPMDARILGPFLANSPAGFSFISAPKEPLVARELNLDGLGRFLKAATQIFPFVIVDCGSATDPVTMKVLESATAIFVVTSPDIIVLNQTKRVLSKIQELLFPPEMVQIVLNRASGASLISPAAVQRNLNRTVIAAIPDDVQTSESALAKSTPFCLLAPQTAVAKSYRDLTRRIQSGGFLDSLGKLKKPTATAIKESDPGKSAASPSSPLLGGLQPVDGWTAMKLRIHKALVEQMDLKRSQGDASDPAHRAVLREKTQKAILDVLNQEDTAAILTTRELKSQMLKEILDEALGLGPLEDLLTDETVTEVMVNARDQIYIEKSGRLTQSKVTFSSEQQMMNVVERIVTPLGRRVDEKVPYVDARLQDGSRVHIIIPPLALRGPTITIRKFPKRRITSKDLVEFGSITEEIADFLRCCVEAALNVVVSGGTGSGKTTLLNVLSNFIPATERIITVEDAAELQLGQEHVVRLESRPKNIEGEGEVSIRELIKCCLRMRPNRIVVGECRGGEALDMLQAMNTGHSGSLTTLHSNNPRECIARLETLVMMSGVPLPSKAIRENIASAVNLIVQQSRLTDGSRKVTHISEVVGMQGEVVSLQDIFIFKQEGLDKKRKIIGRFVPTGFIPKFVEEMEQKGLKIPRSLFAGGAK